jgi:hypothetical protein
MPSFQTMSLMESLICNDLLIIPRRSSEDDRFVENKRCLQWFERWETQAMSTDGISLKEKGKMFMSYKTMFDVYSMIVGF